MTSAEAIEIIKCALAEVEWNYPLDYAAAFEKAIKALDLMAELEKRHINITFRGAE